MESLLVDEKLEIKTVVGVTSVSVTAAVSRSGVGDTVSCVTFVWTVCDTKVMSKLEVTVTVHNWTDVVGVAVMSTPVTVTLSGVIDVGVVVTTVSDSVKMSVMSRLGVGDITSYVAMVTGETDSTVSTELTVVTTVECGTCCHDDTVARESVSVDGVGV